MENLLLKAKHWQMFLFICCLMFVFQITSFVQISTTDSSVLYPLPTAFFLLCLLFWFYFLIKGLNQRIESEELKTKTKYLLFLVVFPVLYTLVTMTFFSIGFDTSINGETEPSPLWLLAIFPIHLFSMFCIFYLMYKVAKTIKIAEIQKPVKFENFVTEFCLLWVFPIGIWFLQPKINKLAE